MSKFTVITSNSSISNSNSNSNSKKDHNNRIKIMNIVLSTASLFKEVAQHVSVLFKDKKDAQEANEKKRYIDYSDIIEAWRLNQKELAYTSAKKVEEISSILEKESQSEYDLKRLDEAIDFFNEFMKRPTLSEILGIRKREVRLPRDPSIKKELQHNSEQKEDENCLSNNVQKQRQINQLRGK